MIDVQNITRRFGSLLAVSGLSFQVPDGTVLALLGQNGAGKTTTVRMLAGLLAPSSGTALVNGYDIHRQTAAVRASVGLVTDVPGLFEDMTPTNYLDFFGNLYGMPPQVRQQKISELLTLFELTEDQHSSMAGFSKGMKQKVALARALLHEPQVLFLDEPTSGLDPVAARHVRDLIRSLKRSQRSIVLCTHDLDEAEKLADNIIIIRQGKIVLRGTPTELRAGATTEVQVHIELADPLPQGITHLDLPNSIHKLEESENGLHIHYLTTDPKAVNPLVQQQLARIGASIVSITTERASLEDVYTSAMQNEIAPVEAIHP
ncbi:multidrug ABC transporter ATP-binding protein [Dictyobacter alpinus]|uniref:Multidrug ABC transporter ATP-binding protein n=1 Tax=Dictyobacter alpinus TaxID=2014873 RepID=A0A402B0U7_9CHLR|nr:ABC transporter ATP-binding protein [Dictyobacter alpinus]GCE24969.1 multidrug ABC transporter ATP-binding protein [Dictyobacter alpinus]